MGNRQVLYRIIVVPPAQQLTEKYGRNFEAKNLHRMMQFPDIEIVAPLARLLMIIFVTSRK